MNTIDNIIKETPYNGVSSKKLHTNNATDILMISMEKGSELPSHVSKKDAQLIMLEGKIRFHIQDQSHELIAHQVLSFKKNLLHRVEASDNSKFLIIR